MSQSFRVNTQDIMHETIDDEVVIVNLDTGAYYAFDGSGQYIWDRLSQHGASQDQLVDEISARSQASVEEISAGVQSFLAQLLDEALIIPTDESEVAPAVPIPDLETGTTDAFVAPQLSKYTDMEALLLADPIHEVEPEGWPHLK